MTIAYRPTRSAASLPILLLMLYGNLLIIGVTIECQPVSPHFMENKEFILQRICIYAGREFDPMVDKQVADVLRSRFNIHLPQRASLDASLESVASDHDIIRLILQYRKMG